MEKEIDNETETGTLHGISYIGFQSSTIIISHTSRIKSDFLQCSMPLLQALALEDDEQQRSKSQ